MLSAASPHPHKPVQQLPLGRTQPGEPVLGFSVAVNDSRTKQALFFDWSL